MTVLDTVLARVRKELGDYSESFQDSFESDGARVIYQLSVEEVNDDVVVQDIDPGNPPVTITPTLYTIENRPGNIILDAPAAVGHILLVTGTFNQYFNDVDLIDFITDAFNLHSAGENPVYTIEQLPVSQVYLVAVLAVIEALWAMATDAAQDIDANLPEGVTVPARERYVQLMQMIDARTAEYKEIAQQMGVGLYRIVIGNLRRVSRTTNRLVPIYIAKEYDDTTYPPTRVYPAIDTGLLQ